MAISNEAGTVIERTNYDPYGGPIGKVVDGIGYTGHVMDPLTGLTNMQQRYYDQGVGRFLSVDPVTASLKDGGNFNRYGYASNNPYKFVDPDGRLPRCMTLIICNEQMRAEDRMAAQASGGRSGSASKTMTPAGPSSEVASAGHATKDDAIRSGAEEYAADAYDGNQEAVWLYLTMSDGSFGFSFPNVGPPGAPEVGIPSRTAILGKIFGNATVTGVFAVGHNHLKPDKLFSGRDVLTFQKKKFEGIDLYLWNSNGEASMLNRRMVFRVRMQDFDGMRVRSLDIQINNKD